MLLRDALEKIQRQRQLRDAEMAALLGIPRTTYSAIKVEKNRVSLRVARRIVAVFPDLTPLALVEDDEPRPHQEREQRHVDRERRAIAMLERRGYTIKRPKS